MNKIISFVILSLFVTVVWFAPDLAFAADPDPDSGASGGFVTCSGGDCSFCHIIDLGSNILNWLFGLVFVLFGVIAFVAGFGLATSGGNQTKLEDAKKKLSNALVGIIIVFSAWLIVDTLLKALIPGGETSVGPWNEIGCDQATQQDPGGGGGIRSIEADEVPDVDGDDGDSEWFEDTADMQWRTTWTNTVTGETGVLNYTGPIAGCENQWSDFYYAHLAENPSEPLSVVRCARVE